MPIPLPLFPGRLWTFLLLAAAGYCAILLLAYLRQDRLLYFPDRHPPEAGAARAKATGFRPWPEDGAPFHGFVHAGGPSAPKGVVLLFHGNAGSALDRTFYARELAPLGYLLILAEYPGYGARGGTPGEAAFVAAGSEAARAAVDRFDAPLYLAGESLGCGVASAVAGSGKVTVAGVLLLTPWDTLPDLAQSLFWYLPAKRLTRERYDIARNLAEFRGPTAVAVAERDEVIPPRHGLRMFDRLPGRKRLWRLAGAGHNDWPGAVDSAWWGDVMRFLEERPQDGEG